MAQESLAYCPAHWTGGYPSRQDITTSARYYRTVDKRPGIFSMLTYNALVKYQQSKDLPATGFCGPLTRAVLESAMSSSTDSSSTPQ
jgi:hypothetical protein